MNSQSKYWKIEITANPWIYLSCPVMDRAELSFSIKRQIVTELQDIEKEVKKDSILKGWIGYTKLTNPHIMVMYLKCKAVPYNIGKGKIWFKKEL